MPNMTAELNSVATRDVGELARGAEFEHRELELR